LRRAGHPSPGRFCCTDSEEGSSGMNVTRKITLAALLLALGAAPALAGDAAVSFMYSPDRLGLSNPVFLSFGGTWERGGSRVLTLDAGFNYQSEFSASTYWVGGYGVRMADRLGVSVAVGGMAAPDGGSLVVGPNVRLDLAGPLSLRYIGLQPVASERDSEIGSFRHLFGLQVRTLSF